MAIIHSPSAPAHSDSFADDILSAVETGLLPDRYEPSAEDWRDYELHMGYLEMMEEQQAEDDRLTCGTFGLPANEPEGR